LGKPFAITPQQLRGLPEKCSGIAPFLKLVLNMAYVLAIDIPDILIIGDPVGHLNKNHTHSSGQPSACGQP
jgi:hypothetical protein